MGQLLHTPLLQETLPRLWLDFGVLLIIRGGADKRLATKPVVREEPEIKRLGNIYEGQGLDTYRDM